MSTSFDEVIERRTSGSAKWTFYDEDVLPMWVADTDFQAAPPIIEALQQRVEHGIFGYALPPAALAEAICARLARLYAWDVAPEQLVYFPGVVTGFTMAAGAASAPDDAVLINTPAYPPILHASEYCRRAAQFNPLVPVYHDGTLRYEIDFAAMEASITAQTRVLLLCNPHNPSGRMFSRAELTRIAELCEQHDLAIISDEIWSDLTLGAAKHTPIASLSPEVSARTVTLMAPSKTFNLPGLGFSFGIIQNETLRMRVQKASEGVVPLANVLGAAAALAAYTQGEPWLQDMRAYLVANRDTVVAYIAEHLPQLRVTQPDATYLAWIDCREAGIGGDPFTFFLERAKVGFADGAHFGPGGEGFVRMNMGCSRTTLLEGLDRMRRALAQAM